MKNKPDLVSSLIPHPSSLSRAVSFLLHFPYPSTADRANTASHLGRWALPTTASYGARTFLSPLRQRDCSRDSPGSDRPAGPRTTLIVPRAGRVADLSWTATRSLRIITDGGRVPGVRAAP